MSIHFSVIIPTCNRPELLSACLTNLHPDLQDTSGLSYEVIVTDDGDSSVTKGLIEKEYAWVRWVEGPHRGPASNRNNGARFAFGSWLVFLDDDCIPDLKWLNAYNLACLENLGCLVLEGRTYAEGLRRSLADEAPLNEHGGYLWSCNFAIERSLFEKIDGFDERFPYPAMEDVELRYRLIYWYEQEILFVQDASVCHPWRPAKGWDFYKKKLDSTIIFLSLHPEKWESVNLYNSLFKILRTLLVVSPKHIVQCKGRGVLSELNRDLYVVYSQLFLLKERYLRSISK